MKKKLWRRGKTLNGIAIGEEYRAVAPKGEWIQKTKDFMVCVSDFAYTDHTPLQGPDADNKFVTFTIKIFCWNKRGVFVNASSVSIIDLDGVIKNYDSETYRYDIHPLYEYISPLLGESIMPEGVIIRTAIFQIRKNQGPWKVVYRDFDSGQKVVVDLLRAPDL